MENIYKQRGYRNRKDYLVSIADEYGIEESTVFFVANILGEAEDFDGLISTIEDGELFI